jgi:hypothetical protein
MKRILIDRNTRLLIARKRACYATPAERVLTDRNLLLLITSFMSGKRIREWTDADLAARLGYLCVLQHAPKMTAVDPLSEAVKNGHVDVAKYLLSVGYRFTPEHMTEVFSRGDAKMFELVVSAGVYPNNAFIHAVRHKDVASARQLVRMILSRAVGPTSAERNWSTRVQIVRQKPQVMPRTHFLQPATTTHWQYLMMSNELARRDFADEFELFWRRGLKYHPQAINIAANHGSDRVFAIIVAYKQLQWISDESKRMALLNDALQGGNPYIVRIVATEFSSLLTTHYDRIRLVIPRAPARGLYALVQAGMRPCAEMAQAFVREGNDILLSLLHTRDPSCVGRGLSGLVCSDKQVKIMSLLRSWDALDDTVVRANVLAKQDTSLADALLLGKPADYAEALMNAACTPERPRVQLIRHLHLTHGIAYPPRMWRDFLSYLRSSGVSSRQDVASALALVMATGRSAPRVSSENAFELHLALEYEKRRENARPQPDENRLKNIAKAMARLVNRC